MDWIGVDLDGTLAEYHGWVAPTEIGIPIPAMVERVKHWLSVGIEVRIVTARACPGPHQIEAGHGAIERAIRAWCLKHIGAELAVTYKKDLQMVELWDDRAVSVELNTGRDLRVAQ